jgi:septum formation protein
MIQLVLASTSPRRIELMKQVGLEALVRSPLLKEEKMRKGEPPHSMVARLATEKALSLAEMIASEVGEAVIIGADTTVVAPDKKTVLNKPTSRGEAVGMLEKLVGRTHQVLTGYCLVHVQKGKEPIRRSRIVESKVTMRKISLKTIERYVDTDEPMDKAGAYAAQGIGMGLISRLDGSYTNVVGLPMAELMMDLEKFFKVEPSWV